MKAVVRIRSLSGLLLALLLAALTMASPAAADTGVSTIAQALRKSPVYVDPSAGSALSSSDADALAQRIKKADKPVFVVVLPADFPKTSFTTLRTATGVTGLYAVRVGNQFAARADSSVLSNTAVQNLVSSVQGEDAKTQLTDFTDRALASMGGSAPASWGGSSDGGGESPVRR